MFIVSAQKPEIGRGESVPVCFEEVLATPRSWRRVACMTIDDAFEIRASVSRVWDALKDIPRVAACMPNVRITGVIDEKTYRANAGVKVGPVSVNYAATIHVDSIDELSHTATMTVKGDDVKGRGGVRATLTSQVVGEGEITRVKLHTEAALTGVIATMGGRLIESVAKKTVAQFAANLAEIV